LPVGKKTSFRRDCDIRIIGLVLEASLTVGKKTSFRRDCDSQYVMEFIIFHIVGKKTSFRRDCDIA